MEQHCMNLRRSQLIGMLRRGQHWMLHWNSTLVITGPRTSSSSSVTVGHAIVVESITEHIHCGCSLTATEWQICSRAVSVFWYSVFAVPRMDAETLAWTVDCVWEVNRFATAQMLKINYIYIDLGKALCDGWLLILPIKHIYLSSFSCMRSEMIDVVQFQLYGPFLNPLKTICNIAIWYTACFVVRRWGLIELWMTFLGTREWRWQLRWQC